MSSKAKRPTDDRERLVRVKDLFPVLQVINTLTERIKTLEMTTMRKDGEHGG